MILFFSRLGKKDYEFWDKFGLYGIYLISYDYMRRVCFKRKKWVGDGREGGNERVSRFFFFSREKGEMGYFF